MRVALITVGDEILSGDTVNSNAAWLGRQLTDRGVDIERTTVIPDRVADIAHLVNEYHAEYDTVIVTGGLGPTHDDVTMEGVAAAFDTEMAEDDAVTEWLETEGGYSGDDLAAGTTHIPQSSEMLRNPMGVAPGCVIGNIYVLPGLPEEMKAMFELIADEFTGESRYTDVVDTVEPESQLLDRIKNVREQFGVTVGSYPGDHVRLKIGGYDPEVVNDAAAWLRKQVEPPEDE